MPKIKFTKMVASGNDFVIAELKIKNQKLKNLNKLARCVCDRKLGIGADGLLLLEKSRVADIRMRIFNADGSEAEMCGNGARCVALYLKKAKIKIETKAGVIEAEVNGDNVKIKLTEPKDIMLDLPIKVNNRNMRINFINTGVPHTVIFAEGLEKIDLVNLGRTIRHHQAFAPQGANVNFIEVLSDNSISLRTYERGVEDETLACGTGSVASALIFALKSETGNKIDVRTKSGEVLKVYFEREKNKFANVWLEGKARIVYQGEYYV